MTNDLMRDYLDGKIHVRSREQIDREKMRRAFTTLAAAFADIGAAFTAIGTGARRAEEYSQALNRLLNAKPNEPADPRERALWAKQQRGTGPDSGALKERGRVTKYQTKG